MNDDVHVRRERLRELLADERIGQLSADDRAEFEALVASSADAPDEAERLDEAVGRLVVLLDSADDGPGMPGDVSRRLAMRGRALVGHSGVGHAGPAGAAGGVAGSGRASGRVVLAWMAAAACLMLAIGVGALGYVAIERRETQLREARQTATERIEENQRLLADARAELERVSRDYDELDARRLELVTRLADATSRLDAAELRIAQFEAPEDPEVLAANRRQLLDLAGTFRVAWQPFDVPGLPETEQRNVTGDVVWNDDLQQGYLRFEGLEVNDPSEEQYQVWVIDERGMEQKVSGGVFNATQDGELIVPIEPGIDVGRVQVFAITVEEPGGIWVPDLKRRVVVAPRGDEQDDG